MACSPSWSRSMAAEEAPSRWMTPSGLELNPFYGAHDMQEAPPPGVFPYTRGLHAEGYRGRLWTMRQYAGFGSAAETNARFRYLLSQGQTGLSVAFDLPTQIGHDSDDPLAEGEVGKVGVAIDSLDDMEQLFAGIPLDQVSTSMTINAPAAVLLLLYELVAERQGVSAGALRGTIQNDILKEYAARGTYIFPPRPSMRLTTDLFAYCAEHLPQWNTISISGYHMREAGATAPQELAFTLANALAYVEAAREAGLAIDAFAPRLSFFFAVFSDFFEEVAKFRAARRLWAQLMRDRYQAQDPRSMMLRFHAQTGGSTLTAQQPHNNIVRVTVQALSAVLGGTQSLHTCSFDEALGLPTEPAALLSLRTQQIIAHETGAAASVDPLGGSYLVESLTDRLQQEAETLLARVEALGGAVAAIERGFMQNAIQESAYRQQVAVEREERVIVGVNRYLETETPPVEIVKITAAQQAAQVKAVQGVRARRDGARVRAALAALKEAAQGRANLLPLMKEALRAYATVGDVCDALREIFGEYRAQRSA